MSEVKQITIPWWVLLIIGAVIVVLFLKFCQKDNSPNNIQQIADAVQKKHAEDSIQYTSRQKELLDSSQTMKRQIEWLTSVFIHTDSVLSKTITENKKLIQKYKNSSGFTIPTIDTGSSLVPAEFINDCKDCFTQLEKTTDSVEQYRYEADQMRVLYIDQARIDSILIAGSGTVISKLNKDYNDLRMAIEVNAKSFEPKRKLKVGIGGRFDNQFLPNGVGPGLMYQDKKDRNFAFTPIYGNGQPAYVVEVFVPLFSF